MWCADVSTRSQFDVLGYVPQIPLVDTLPLALDTVHVAVHEDEERNQTLFVQRRAQQRKRDGERRGAKRAGDLAQDRHADAEEAIALRIAAGARLEKPTRCFRDTRVRQPSQACTDRDCCERGCRDSRCGAQRDSPGEADLEATCPPAPLHGWPKAFRECARHVMLRRSQDPDLRGFDACYASRSPLRSS
jgi:hypothetical protein